MGDECPTDPQVVVDFGYANLTARDDWSKLSGLYVGLLKILNVSTRDLHEWQIHAYEYNLPENSREEYFPWFLRNQHVVSQSALSAESTAKAFFEQTIVSARQHIGGSNLDSLAKIMDDLLSWGSGTKMCFRALSIHSYLLAP